jgi:hypothetical protein
MATPVILATQEAETQRITISGQLRQIVLRLHLQNNKSKNELEAWLKW